jgi:hypothetical protein
VDPTRRRFLTVAAVGSMVSAGTLAAAALRPNDVPQAVTMTPAARIASASPAFAPAVRKMAAARQDWTAAREAVENSLAPVRAWEVLNPIPESNRKLKRCAPAAERRELHAVNRRGLAIPSRRGERLPCAQMEVAQIPATSRADILLKACLAATYDAEHLSRHQAGIIAFGLATDIVRLELDDRKAVQS